VRDVGQGGGEVLADVDVDVDVGVVEWGEGNAGLLC
jgi:hypothetical protein